MLLSKLVIRRYTPPTCTLEIGRSSPMFPWMGRSGLKQLRFELRFDDPQLPEQQRVKIQGDRDQLETLQEAVTTYVQNLLNSPDQFNAGFSGGATSSDSAVSSTPPLVKANDLALAAESPSLDISSATDVEEISSQKTATPFRKIFLQPGTGLSHDLFLESIANQDALVIHLSMLQLFDLANALDEYAADVAALPITPNTAPVPAWTYIAAVLLLAVGLTTMVQLLNRPKQQQTATTTIVPGSSSNNQQIVQPAPTAPLSSLQLPPPPPTGSIPSANSIPPINIPGTNSALPSAPRVNLPQPTTPSPRQTTRQQIVIKPAEQNRSVIIPKEAATSVRPTTLVIPSPSPQIVPRDPNLEAALSQASRVPVPVPAVLNPNSTRPNPNSVTQTRSPSTPTPPRRTSNTIPQVAEAKAYFQQRWQPPSSLKQTLEYSLLLDVDGTIQRIEPLGQAARTYIETTGMPLIGERFVSPIQDGQTPRLRLVLAPDGKVQAFREEIP